MTSKQSELKDVLIVGFGAVGAVYGLVLEKGGFARVTVVARSNYSIIREEGMHYRSKTLGDVTGWKPHRICNSVAEASDRAYAYVIVTTKALPELHPTSQMLYPLCGPSYEYPQPTYVLLQNGLGVERDLYDALRKLNTSKPRIFNTSLWIYTNLLSDNLVECNTPGRLAIGLFKPEVRRYDSFEEGEREQLTEFADILSAGGVAAEVVPDIQCLKYKKSFWNLAFSSFATLTRNPVATIFQDPVIEEQVVPEIRALLEELLAIVRAVGYNESALPSSVIDECIGSTAQIHRDPNMRHKASMLLDLECSRPIEVEVIIGELARTAKKVGVPTPRIDLIYAFLFIIQKQLIKR